MKDTAIIEIPVDKSTVQFKGISADMIGDVIEQMMQDENSEQILETGFLIGFGKLDDTKKDMLLASILLVTYLHGKADCIPDMLESVEETIADMVKK